MTTDNRASGGADVRRVVRAIITGPFPVAQPGECVACQRPEFEGGRSGCICEDCATLLADGLRALQGAHMQQGDNPRQSWETMERVLVGEPYGWGEE